MVKKLYTGLDQFAPQELVGQGAQAAYSQNQHWCLRCATCLGYEGVQCQVHTTVLLYIIALGTDLSWKPLGTDFMHMPMIIRLRQECLSPQADESCVHKDT